ncbi:MAG: ABC transporter substrate-binding protein [Treponema sp.]|jgi:ABC-type nitrate/sulfonate/bicarbonate transport system substrate-binding protein|nr:ABC transporter substrate-binding protein [Treponema sp.]
MSLLQFPYMKKIIFLLLAALLAASCGSRKREPGHIRVVLDWTPNTNHTGLYIALEKGLFAEEGLMVEIVQPPEDGALLLLASGNAEFAVDFQETLGPAIAKNEEALPLTAVAAVISRNTSGIVSLAGKGITRPRDLEGKRFASWETPLVTAVIKSIVEEDEGDFSKVQMIPNFATDAFSAMETEVDAVWIFYAWDGIAAETRGLDINYLELGRLNPIFDFYTPVLVCNNNWLNANPETAKKFLMAASRGYAYSMEFPDEASEILLKYAPELDRETVKASQRYLVTRYKGDAPRWGEIDKKRWDQFYRWMYNEGLLEKDPVSGGFTNEYLPD